MNINVNISNMYNVCICKYASWLRDYETEEYQSVFDICLSTSKFAFPIMHLDLKAIGSGIFVLATKCK